MGLFSKLFGRSGENDDEKEIRLYNEEKSAPHTVTEASGTTTVSEGCPDGAYACFEVSDAFNITGRGTVVTGTVTKGSFSVGDKASLNGMTIIITGVEKFRKQCDTVSEGENAGLLLSNIDRFQVGSGDLIIK